MRLLIVDPNRTERANTLRLIPADLHEIKLAVDAAEALNLLEASTFDVVLVESTMTGTTGDELVKRIRARESDTHVYVVMTASRPIAGDLKTAFAVGADDFVRKPLNRDELLSRMDGPTRIRRWAQVVYNSNISADFGAQTDITETAMWSTMSTTVCSEISDMLGFQFAPGPADDPLDGSTYAAQLPLSIASEQSELCLAVGLDDASAAILAEAMFGGPADAVAIRDMVREIANVAGGALKRLAVAENKSLTTHVPTETDRDTFRHECPLARRHWIAVCEGGPLALRFEMELRLREPKLVRIASLREGMVVATDLRNPKGALLMKSGTRITESHLGGLARCLGADSCIEVLEAA